VGVVAVVTVEAVGAAGAVVTVVGVVAVGIVVAVVAVGAVVRVVRVCETVAIFACVAHHGNSLQLQIPLVPEILPSLRPLDHIHILDPYAKLAFGIVSRLVGDDHSVLHRHVVVGRSLAHALRAFVHVEERANAMRGRVAERAGERSEPSASLQLYVRWWLTGSPGRRPIVPFAQECPCAE
jgi:hypothetical protein